MNENDRIDDLTAAMRAVRAPAIRPRTPRSLPALPLALGAGLVTAASVGALLLWPAPAPARTWGQIAGATREAKFRRTRALIDGVLSTDVVTDGIRRRILAYMGKPLSLELRFDGRRNLMWTDRPQNWRLIKNRLVLVGPGNPAAFACSTVRDGPGELRMMGSATLEGATLLSDITGRQDAKILDRHPDPKFGGEVLRVSARLYSRTRPLRVVTDDRGRIRSVQYDEVHVGPIQILLDYPESIPDALFGTDEGIRGSTRVDLDALKPAFAKSVREGLGTRNGVTLRAVVHSQAGEVRVFWSRADGKSGSANARLIGVPAKATPDSILTAWRGDRYEAIRQMMRKNREYQGPPKPTWKGALSTVDLVPKVPIGETVDVAISTPTGEAVFRGVRTTRVRDFQSVGRELGYDVFM